MQAKLQKKLFLFILTTLILMTLALTSVNCGGREQLPEGWKSHSFKLTEHPEVFIDAEKIFNEIRGYKTIQDDTRTGFMMGVKRELSFDVFLPSTGSIKFAYGYGPGIFRFGKNIKLTIKAKGEGFDQVLGSWEIEPLGKDEAGKWVEIKESIYPDAAGDARLTFSLAGMNKPSPAGAFFLAHPTIVTPDENKKCKRVIWISIDTLRPDHMGCYGYERPTTPNIDALAKESTIFDRCIAESPWTLPSYASMFTGRYPTTIGCTTNVRFLPKIEKTLASIVSSGDFATFSVHNAPWVGVSYGLHRGFDVSKQYKNQYADVSFELAEEWMLNHADENCFVFIHLYDPHLPYEPKEKLRDTFDPGYEGRYKYEKKNFDGLMMGTNEMTDKEKAHVVALYDEEILGCDVDTGDFLDFLKENGFYKDSLIIINADHGEEFWEHGWFAHGRQLYDETLHVPLIIHGPGFDKGKRINQMCGAFDIFPTIIEWLGMDAPEEISAVSLFDTVKGVMKPESRMHLSEQLYFGTEQKGVTTDKYRYILKTIDCSEELYDVTDDPEMTQDISTDRRAASRNFRFFVTEYTLNEGVGWHVRIYRTPGRKGERGGGRYEGRIVAPSGFAEATPTKLDDRDVFEWTGNELRFSISISNWGDKAFDFRTNDENDMVEFEVLTDGQPEVEQFVFLGPDKLPAPSTTFTLSILDPMFGLGTPQFGSQGSKHHGFYMWGNSNTLREQSTPDIDDRTREELRSLGYLH